MCLLHEHVRVDYTASVYRVLSDVGMFYNMCRVLDETPFWVSIASRKGHKRWRIFAFSDSATCGNVGGPQQDVDVARPPTVCLPLVCSGDGVVVRLLYSLAAQTFRRMMGLLDRLRISNHVGG